MNDFFKHCNDYKIRKLSLDETVKSFNCGDNDLNDFIINDAKDYKKIFTCNNIFFRAHSYWRNNRIFQFSK